jgi:hypothetical protein
VFTDLLIGPLSLWFWMFAVVGGLLPLLLVALPWTRNVRGMVFAAAFVLPMMWLKRFLLVVGPATYDTVTHTFGTYHFTWVPIAITLAATAAVPLLLMLLFRVVPLLSIDEIEEIEQVDELEKTVTASPLTESTEPAGHDGRLVGATNKSHRVAGASGVLLLAALLGVLGVGVAHPAQAATAPVAPAITITGVEADGLMELTATLTGPDHPPRANAGVAFLFSTTEFGTPARLVPLGSATTDQTGIARLTLGGDADHLYRPTATGPQEFVASYTAVGGMPVTSSTTVAVTVARSAYHPAPPKPLASVGKVLVVVLFAIVAAIWLTLVTQVVRVRRVCRGVVAAGSDRTGRSARPPVNDGGKSPSPSEMGTLPRPR